MAQALLPIAHPVVPRSRLWGWALAASVAVAGAGLWRYATLSGPPAATTVAPATRSIAVLPIKNLTGDASKRYLADGLTEVLISNLARVRGFRVPSFAAVTGIGDDALTPATLASKLGVQLLLTGSVAQADSQFRMAVNLIDPTTGVAIWGEEIVREASAMLSAQADIARFVAERLAMTLSQDELQALQARSIDPRAQELYLRGLAIRVTQPAGRRDAARLFRQATEVDGSFAAAWADLALVEVVLNNEEPPPTRRARGAVIREMAERAIRLDPAMGSGYAALGTIQFYDLWDFKSAEATFRKALTVDPSDGFVRQRLSMLLAALGRVDEAIAMAMEAVQVEPVVPARAVALAATYYYARDYDRAEAELRRARQLSPGFAPPLFTLGQIAAARGRYDEAESFVRQALDGTDYIGWLIELARISALAGRIEASQQIVNQIDERLRRGEWVSPDNFAYVAVARGRYDEAFRILTEAVDQRAINVLWLAVDPRVDALRNDARFDPLLRKAGLRP
jgi:TolB-like protein/Tfp pilus assembly protein PilF